MVRAVAAAPLKKTRVLLADDHSVVIEGLRRILESEFDVVGTATNGLALIQAVRQLRPEVIVVDVSMPVLNGIDAARQIAAGGHAPKIVFLSMHPELVYAAKALAAGGSGYVLKSSAGVEIVHAIREALQGRTFVTPALEITSLREGGAGNEKSAAAIATLSPRQRQIVQMVAEGRSSKEIAAILRISPRTVEFHRYRAMDALDVHTVAELVQYAIRNLILPQ